MDRFVVDLAVRGAVVLAATGAIAFALRRASAATKHLVWSLGAAALASLPFLERILPDLVVTFLPVSAAAAPGPTWETAASSGPPWTFWIWIAGVALVGLTVVVGRSRVWWLARTSHRLTGGPLRALATRLCGEIGLSRRIDLRVVDRPIMPMMWGVVRPTILLPAEIERWPEDRQRHVLLHELSHVQRNDYPAQVLGRIACALHWFNPLAWIAVRRMREERERACDDHVLETGTSVCDYAEDLLEVARSLRSTPVHVTAIGMAHASAFGERLAALLDAGRRRGRLDRRTVVGSIAVAACVVAPLAAVQPEARTVETDEAGWQVVSAEPAHDTRSEARRRIDSVRRAEERLRAATPAEVAVSLPASSRPRTVMTMAAAPIDVVVGDGGPRGTTSEESCETDESQSPKSHEPTPAHETRLATSGPSVATP